MEALSATGAKAAHEATREARMVNFMVILMDLEGTESEATGGDYVKARRRQR